MSILFFILKKSYWKAAHKFWYFNEKVRFELRYCVILIIENMSFKDISWNAEKYHNVLLIFRNW